MKIIDSHCHVYPQSIASRAVRGVSDFYDGVHSFGDGLASTVRQLWPGRGVSHAVIFSVALKVEQIKSINSFIANTVATDPSFFTGLGTVHQDAPDMGEVVDSIISLGLRGVKIHPDEQECAIDDPRFLSMYEACGDRIPVLIHTGDSRYDFSNPDRMANALRLFPNVTFIGAHYGGWSVWDEAVAKLSRFDNFFVDTSSTFNWVSSACVKSYIRAYGSSKIMFGSDFPMWDVKPEIDSLMALNLSDREYEDIFHNTAEALFHINP